MLARGLRSLFGVPSGGVRRQKLHTRGDPDETPHIGQLLESRPEVAVELAHKILKYKAWGETDLCEKHPYAWAGWTLIREDDKKLRTVDEVLQVTDGDVSGAAASTLGGCESGARSAAAGAMPSRGGECRAPNLKKILLWAQEHAYSLRDSHVTDADKRSQLLIALLERMSVDPGVTDCERGKLWSGQFARLLSVPSAPGSASAAAAGLLGSSSSSSSSVAAARSAVSSSSRAGGLDVQTFRSILLSRPEPEADWEPLSQQFCELLQLRGDASWANETWRNDATKFLFWQAGASGSSSEPRGGGRRGPSLDKDVVRGLLNVAQGTGDLEVELQMELLLGNVEIGRDVLAERFIRTVSEALKETFAEKIRINGSPDFIEKVRAKAQQKLPAAAPKVST